MHNLIGQHHTLAGVPAITYRQYQLQRRLLGPSGLFGEEVNTVILPGIEQFFHDLSAHSDNTDYSIPTFHFYACL